MRRLHLRCREEAEYWTLNSCFVELENGCC